MRRRTAFNSRSTNPAACRARSTSAPQSFRAACNALSLFLRCFENQHQQWDYANLDTLTRLLNRKTFDDDFDRLMHRAVMLEFEGKSYRLKEAASRIALSTEHD